MRIGPLWAGSLTLRNAGSDSAACVLCLFPPRGVYVRLLPSVASFAGQTYRGSDGVEVGEPPPPPCRARAPCHQKKKKCGFIAASLGQRASGVSLPHGTIISSVHGEKYGLETERGRGGGLKIEMMEQTPGDDTLTACYTLFSIKHKSRNGFHYDF